MTSRSLALGVDLDVVFIWEIWDEPRNRGSPRDLIKGIANLAPPCSNSHTPSSTPSCRLTGSTQIAGPQVQCLKQRTYTLTLTSFKILFRPNLGLARKIKDQRMHYSTSQPELKNVRFSAQDNSLPMTYNSLPTPHEINIASLKL
jgi:hypothetical protein